MIPTWAQLVYLLCAVCFILALKGLSGPKTARAGNLIGAAAAVVAVRAAVLLPRRPRPRRPDPGRDRGRHRRRRLRRAAGPDDPDAADGGAVQRRRRRRGRAGRAARARTRSRGRAPTSAGSSWSRRRSRSSSAGLLRRLGGHLRQAAGPDDLAAGGLPGPAGRLRRLAARRGRAVRCWSSATRRSCVGDRARPGRPAVRRAAGAAGRRRRRPDRDLAAQRVHRPDRRRRRLRARPTRCCWWPAPWSAPPARS